MIPDVSLSSVLTHLDDFRLDGVHHLINNQLKVAMQSAEAIETLTFAKAHCELEMGRRGRG